MSLLEVKKRKEKGENSKNLKVIFILVSIPKVFTYLMG
jgi:hypothetical protein